MNDEDRDTERRIALKSLQMQIGEDPLRQPMEKETIISIEGDADRATITSFKRVVYEKCLQHPKFELKWVNVIDKNARIYTTPCLDVVRKNPYAVIIGITGTIPVGCLSIGAARNSNSHAEIVKL